MSKAKTGWHGQSLRHSNAKRLGKAGGTYKALTKKIYRGNPVIISSTDKYRAYVQTKDSNGIGYQWVDKKELFPVPTYSSKKESSYKSFKPVIPIKDKASLPVQFSITIPSTKDANKSIGQKGLDKRVKETNKFIVDRFYGDTTLRAKGDYTSDGKLIAEDVAVIEVSTNQESFNKYKQDVAKYIKDKRKAWGQKQMAYTTEGDLFLYPEDPDKTPLK